MNLIEALNFMLTIAKQRLGRAELKEDQWSIDHYKNDIKKIEKQLTKLT